MKRSLPLILHPRGLPIKAMLYKKSLSAFLAALILASQTVAQQSSRRPGVVEAARLRTHVTYLASDRLEGRRTGTSGATEAANYIAGEFRGYGLKPGGVNAAVFDSKASSVSLKDVFFQPFPYVAGVELGKGNALTATRRIEGTTQGAPLAIDFRIDEDWTPLGFSSNA